MTELLPILTAVLIVSAALLLYGARKGDEVSRAAILKRRLRGVALAPVAPALQPKADKAPPRRSSESGRGAGRIDRWLLQGGIHISAAYFVCGVALIVVGTLAVAVAQVGPAFAILYGAGFGLVPIAYVARQRRKRLATFAQQLPYILDFLRSSLGAGHTLLRALQLASENAPEPIATELRLAVEQIKVGASLPEALESMFRRLPEESLAFLIVAVRIQAEVGSGVAEIIDRVTERMRARQRLRQQIRALTGQARMSGWTVAILPFVVLLILSVLKPDYTRPLLPDPVGFRLLETAIVLDVVAAAMIRWLLKLE
ncbi:MAG: type II secretion system F family protein [Candidatus Binataceae bacterium]